MISNQQVSQTYQGNNATLTFAIPFTFFSNSQIKVELVDKTNPSAPTISTLVLGTHYNLIGSPATQVNMTSAPTITQQLVITRVTVMAQSLDYITGQPFPADAHETQMDLMVMMTQEVSARQGVASVHPPVGMGSLTLPQPIAGSILGWDGTGTQLANFNIAVLQGPQGPQGPAGPSGQQGASGLNGFTNTVLVSGGSSGCGGCGSGCGGCNSKRDFRMIQEIPIGAVNGFNRVFKISQKPISNESVLVFSDGNLMYPSEYIFTTSNEIRTNVPVAPGSSLYLVYPTNLALSGVGSCGDQASRFLFRQRNLTGLVNGLNKLFTFVNTDIVMADSIKVFIDGHLAEKSEYSLTNPNIINFVTAPAVGSSMVIYYAIDGLFASGNASDPLRFTWEQGTPLGVVSGANVTFTIPYTINDAEHVVIYSNGNLVHESEYTFTAPGTVAFNIPPAIGSQLYYYVVTADAVSVANSNWKVEYLIVSPTNVGTKKLSLLNPPVVGSDILVDKFNGTVSVKEYGIDFIVVGNELRWNGLGMDGVIAVNDRLRISYFW